MLRPLSAQHTHEKRAHTHGHARSAIGAALGNMFEFYDFTAFAFFIPILTKVFFPNQNPYTAALLSLMIFGTGFLARPVGSIVIGYISDRAGRRTGLMISIFTMALSMTLLAAAPTYDQAGALAPLIITISRLLQGFAIGGEPGAVSSFLYEIAPAKRKSFYSSFQIATQGWATVMAGIISISLSVSLSPSEMEAWGWRFPFLFGLIVLPIGLWLRANIRETMLSGTNQSMAEHIYGSITGQPKDFVAAILQVTFGTVAMYTCIHMGTYSYMLFGAPRELSAMIVLVVGLSTTGGALMGGYLSDRVGAYRVAATSRVVVAIIAPAIFYTMSMLKDPVVIVAGTGILAAISTLSMGSYVGVVVAAFNPRTRSTQLSIMYAVTVSVFGGGTPILSHWLATVTGNSVVPALIVSAAAIISFFGMATLAIQSRHLLDRGEEESIQQMPRYSCKSDSEQR